MAGLTKTEFAALLAEPKVVAKDIEWIDDEDHSPTVEFLAEAECPSGSTVTVRGSFNAEALTVSFMLIHRPSGRVYGLDLGKDHRNPDGNLIGEKHKHSWTEDYRDKLAYVPADITDGVDNPIAVWQQFCTEANILHTGRMKSPFREKEFFGW